MKNFCTDIIETAKMRGLSRGECRDRGGSSYTITNSYTTETVSIKIGKGLLNLDNRYVKDEVNRELKQIFREVAPKEINNTDILDSIIERFIG